jgi:hypothetical protein
VPTILREGSWRFFFYSNEGSEPPHIHVAGKSGGEIAKFWLTPVSVVRSQRIHPHELRSLERLVAENRDLFVRKWNEHFATP